MNEQVILTQRQLDELADKVANRIAYRVAINTKPILTFNEACLSDMTGLKELETKPYKSLMRLSKQKLFLVAIA